jgi:hypothetical protein
MNDGLDGPCDLVPLAMETCPQAHHPVSPVSVEDCSAALAPQEKEDQCTNPTVKPTIRINESPASAPPSINQATSARKQTPSSILRHAPTAPPTVSATSLTIMDSLSEVPASRSIIDRQCKLLIEIDDDGHKKMFHLEDFVSLYPSWPIIKLTISPMGNTKDNRMNHFIKCCASLFAEILYVDDTTAIAPIEITDNRKDSYITDKASLPANFTKLGKWIMISRGSWVFNIKEKGSNNVYKCFRLLSQVAANDIIN